MAASIIMKAASTWAAIIIRQRLSRLQGGERVQKNPYISLLNLMEQVSRSSNSPDIQIGQILAFAARYQGPLQWHHFDRKRSCGFPIISWQVMAAQLKGHLVSATQNRAGGSGDAAYQSHNHDIDNDYTDSVIYTDTLKARHVRGHHAHAHQRPDSAVHYFRRDCED
jgi:hypothetical protein